jgi:4-alpha-glucanotransferase
MKFKRSAGILLHPTSLPGPYGIGDLGPEAFRWIDFLFDSGCGLWQVLPLGPTGYGDSPYQCFSAFAGNAYLISPQLLIEDHLLSKDEISARPEFPHQSVDYGAVINWKLKVLDLAFNNFQKKPDPKLKLQFEKFLDEKAFWLNDFALFMAIKDSEGGKAWNQWTLNLRQRNPEALKEFENKHLINLLKHKFNQFLFFRQWKSLHEYAHKKGIKIIGDIPIFVANDSADAWAHTELFFIDEKGKPSVIAGVPPDYFSPTGQLWGNPLYKWDLHKSTNYAWWIERIKSTLEFVDIIRLDHFRGFAASWQVPYGKKTAEKGKWVPGPGPDLFNAFQNSMGDLPLIAEDLGVITPDVTAMRNQFEFPGMKILQFAFADEPNSPSLPHHFNQNCVVYTGTHDNDTSCGWYANISEKERDFCRRYLARSGSDISWDLVRAAWSSVADMALAPMQDFLSLGSDARMNFPSKASGNWTWRMTPQAITKGLVDRLLDTNLVYDRLNPLTVVAKK